MGGKINGSKQENRYSKDDYAALGNRGSRYSYKLEDFYNSSRCNIDQYNQTMHRQASKPKCAGAHDLGSSKGWSSRSSDKRKARMLRGEELYCYAEDGDDDSMAEL